MSTDAHLAHACPHHIRFERTLTDATGMGVPTLSPISGAGLLLLRRDGVPLPPTGLFSPAQVVFPKRAPYRVKATSNVLVVDGVSYSIPPKTYTASEMISWLTGALPSYTVEAYDRSVKIASPLESTISLSGSALITTFGSKRSELKGKRKQVTPEWSLSRNDLSGISIRFKKPLDPVGLLDVSYLTEKRLCRRCGGTGVENDLRLDTYGDISMLTDHNLLYQMVAKAVLTERGSNPFHSWYGSTATSLIGQKVNSAVVQALRDSVYDTLSRMIDVQSRQAEVQSVSAKERLASVLSVEVEPIGDDLTSLLCTVVVRSASSEPVSVTVVFAVPNSIPLDGDLS